MELRLALPDEIVRLTQLSKAAFDTDIDVGASEPGGPPEYDCLEWHRQMCASRHLFTALEGDTVIGGALLFEAEGQPEIMYVGRIFIDPALFRKGYGLSLMRSIEALFPHVRSWQLDTPLWNVRTNAFYQKLGYRIVRTDDEFAYYEKRV